MEEKMKIKSELAKVGIFINDIYDLVNSNKPYPGAISILLNFLEEGIQNVSLKEGVIRALGVKEAAGIVNSALIEEYNNISKEMMLLKWIIGNTFYTIITKEDIEDILRIINNKENGMSRQMFVLALGKFNSNKTEDVLINLLDDEEITPHILEVLGKMKSKKAKSKILLLINHPKSLIRKEAQKALVKIN